MEKKGFILLLPYSYSIIGWILLALAIAAHIIRYIIGYPFPYLEWKVFAFVSIYFESKYFSIITNNVSEEICSLFLLLALLFITFSQRKKLIYTPLTIREKAFIIATYINVTYLIMAIIFIYGFAFMYACYADIFLWFIFFGITHFILSLKKNKHATAAL